MKTKYIKAILCWFIFSGVIGNAFTQTPLIKKINIGELVPNYFLTNLLNYSSDSINLAGFKNKLLILDFWTFGCKSCVESWPKLMKLQQDFGDKIQIVTVIDQESRENISKFIRRQESIHQYKMTLPVAYGDKNLKRLFPYTFVPHVVFIDQNSRVKFITEGSSLNYEYIQKTIDGMFINLPEKTDDYTKIAWSKPLFMGKNLLRRDSGTNVAFSSVITPYSNEIWGIYAGGTTKNNESFGFIGNYPVKDMLRVLYSKKEDFNSINTLRNAWIRFENVDSTNLVGQVNGTNRFENRYTIQFTAKTKIPVKMIRQRMIYDIELFFGIKTGWETRKVKCLVVSRSKYPLVVYTDGEKIAKLSETFFSINKLSIEDLIDRFIFIPSFFNVTYPIVNETCYAGYLGRIKFEAPIGKLLDFRLIGSSLAKYGLQFSIEEREVALLIVKPAER